MDIQKITLSQSLTVRVKTVTGVSEKPLLSAWHYTNPNLHLMKNSNLHRRQFVKRSIAGIAIVGSPVIPAFATTSSTAVPSAVSPKFPGTDDADAQAVVGASHGNFEKVKELVSARPELALATWDWGFGDWETALGAASHVGRRDIAEFLIAHGARPDHFTFAMFGALDAVKGMMAASPGLQRVPGPHGITLLQHALTRLGSKTITAEDKKNVEAVVSYLESLGDADVNPTSLAVSDADKKMYAGTYRFDEGENGSLEVFINDRQLLQIKRSGAFGRNILLTDNHTFAPAGAPSVRIKFEVINNTAVSLTIHHPDPILTAKRV
jgi:hypothetical protein